MVEIAIKRGLTRASISHYHKSNVFQIISRHYLRIIFKRKEVTDLKNVIVIRAYRRELLAKMFWSGALFPQINRSSSRVDSG